MWNPREHQEEDDDSWEVRAFAEDTRNIMATTWPPRSYSCTFCRREFRSAQALGGHMNVHRRDRARLHHHHHNYQHHPPAPAAMAVATTASQNPTSSSHLLPRPSSFMKNPSSSSSSSSSHQDLGSNGGTGGLCLLYQLPSPNENFAPYSAHHGHNSTTLSACGKLPPSTLVSVSSHPPNYNMVASPFCSPSSFDHFTMAQATGTNGFSSHCSSTKQEEPSPSSLANCGGRHDELDLELRLGRKSPPNRRKN